MYFAKSLSDQGIEAIYEKRAGHPISENERRAFIEGFKAALSLTDYIMAQPEGPEVDQALRRIG